jgi:predicted alpha/beta hydrolase
VAEVSSLAIAAHDGHPLAARRFAAAGPEKAAVVLAPAMAVPQVFYAEFAAWLATQGYTAWTFDYRGTGASLKGSLRGFKADLSDWLMDYDAVVQRTAAAGHPVFALGHSLGGQMAPLLPSRARLAGLVNIAVGSGSLRHNQPHLRRKAPLMWYLMAPLLCPLFGYFPGARLGVIGDLPTGAMFQWRRWCLTPDYILSGEPGAREAYASARFAVLGLSFADDELLLEAGSRMLHDAYGPGRADYRVIDPAAIGNKRVGHFGFFKPGGRERLWPMVGDWLDQQLAGGTDT